MDILSSIKDLFVLAADAPHAAAEHAAPLMVQAIKRVPYLFLIPLFPLIGSAINAFAGHAIQKRWGKRVTSNIAIGAMAAAFCVAAGALVQMLRLPAGERYLVNHLWNMFTAGDVQANLSFALDPLSMMMTLIITFIGALIHLYSQGYMADEPSYWRFFCYLNLFVFSMLLLVMGDNFALMFFGWEGVGLCSYLLIGFWYTDLEKARAAVKAFVTNRIGDFGFVLGLFLLFWALGGSWQEKKDLVPDHESRWAAADPTYQPQKQSGVFYQKDAALSPRAPPAHYEEVSRLEQPGGGWTAGDAIAVRGTQRVGPTLSFRELRDQIAVEGTGVKERLTSMTFIGFPLLAVIGILLFIGATAKSAQIPLYVWLPDAMAGPTPVSALIHAATMVTAGVYMVARLNFLFALSTTAMTVVAVTGAATALFAATIGFAQTDIKKVLAYSTVSQLGFMFIGVGVGAYWAGVYHLLTHAFFKACLFLGSGSVILGCHHEQDMTKMGGLKKYMPLTEKTYFYACVAIAGFPIANGFFSKDEILWKAFIAGDNLLDPAVGQLIWLVGWITALGTSFYMWRSYYMTFSGEYRGGHGHADPHHAHGGLPHESPRSMTWVLVTLAVGCAVTVLLGFFPYLGHLTHVEWMARPILERWLDPVLQPSHGLVQSRLSPTKDSGGVELLLILASVAVAFVGLFAARALYKDNQSTVPARFVARFPGLRRTVFNKYYVDELYQKTVLSWSMLAARAMSVFDQVVIDGLVNAAATVGRFVCNIEGAIDKYLVDGAVNLVAAGALRIGTNLRRLQSGRIQHYLYAALAGALVVVGINFLIR